MRIEKAIKDKTRKNSNNEKTTTVQFSNLLGTHFKKCLNKYQGK